MFRGPCLDRYRVSNNTAAAGWKAEVGIYSFVAIQTRLVAFHHLGLVLQLAESFLLRYIFLDFQLVITHSTLIFDMV